MNDGFLYIKSQDVIIPLDKITRINFIEDDPDEEEEAALEITDTNNDTYSIEGDEAESLYIELIKVLPNLITIGK